MSIPVNNIIRSVNRTYPLNILWMPYNGVFEHMFFNSIPHHYYISHDVECEYWDTKLFPYAKNCYKLSKCNKIPITLDLDLIVCNSRYSQLSYAQALSRMLHIPVVLIEHKYPEAQMKKEDIHLMVKNTNTDIVVNTETDIQKAWMNNDYIIEYGIPDLYKETERKEQILFIGKFDPKDIQYVNNLQNHIKIPIKIIGDNPGCVPYTQTEFINEMQNSKYVLSITSNNKIPLTSLLAISCGCIPVTNKHIIDTEYIYSNMTDLIKILSNIETQPNNHNIASQQVQQRFPYTTFVDCWNNIFNMTRELFYKG